MRLLLMLQKCGSMEMENKLHAVISRLKKLCTMHSERGTVCERQRRSALIAFNRIVLYHQYYNQRGDG